ncbi:hypothetical protein PsorP6_007695 [Peronosclerospora sorghi]|uniref:Uncharacterized protein n=1 Tax=Peronosclerospora sorghi TaxID=230839 RepID=A0ACC0W9E1_9STRA|nr:hypothetical protein PsorP6_007695 [Peronosclerospora sorghi]
MVLWKIVCAIAALYALGAVEPAPLRDDVSDTSDELVILDENFPGYGAALSKNASPTSGTLSTGTIPGSEKYHPGLLHAPLAQRRLELTKSVDTKKLETFFSRELEFDLTKLPTKCDHHPAPWPSSYWPSYVDGINYRWAKNQPSPSEKYATAFGHDVATLMGKISAKRGIDSGKKRKKCTHDNDCKVLLDGSVCAKSPSEKNSSYCVPTWFGVCHAWAPASCLEPEPICPVERNGVIFEPYDIKALITMAYDGSKISSVFLGSRCNSNDRTHNKTDQYGRYEDPRRLDISPSLFHLLATNVLCLFNHTFVVDISSGMEVWNQPARKFQILRMYWMTPTEAAKKYFNVDKYPFNDAATKIAVITSRFSWVAESGVNGPLVSTGLVDKYTKSADYDYILETDETYKIWGGEWLGESKYNHLDFAWLPAQTPDNSTVTAEGIVYAEVKSLLDESIRGDCGPPSPGRQATNPVPMTHTPDGTAHSGAQPAQPASPVPGAQPAPSVPGAQPGSPVPGAQPASSVPGAQPGSSVPGAPASP